MSCLYPCEASCLCEIWVCDKRSKIFMSRVRCVCVTSQVRYMCQAPRWGDVYVMCEMCLRDKRGKISVSSAKMWWCVCHVWDVLSMLSMILAREKMSASFCASDQRIGLRGDFFLYHAYVQIIKCYLHLVIRQRKESIHFTYCWDILQKN